jgi:biopolymer transport protein ExbB
MIASSVDRQSNAVRSTVAGCLLAAFLLWPQCVFGTSGNFEQQLEQAVERAQDELRDEGERIQNEQEARQRQLEEIRTACRGLSSELVERKLSIAYKQRALAQLRRRRETLWNEQTQWQQERVEIELICRDVAKELGALSQTLPISESRDEQNHWRSALDSVLDQGDLGQAVPQAVALVRSFLNETRTNAIFEADVIDPRGTSQKATLLRVGQSFFAYHVPGTAQTAIAISAPYEQKGFRWQEALPGKMRQTIVEATEQTPASSEPIWLPIDVTGRITAATNLSAKTLADRLQSGGAVMIPLAFVALCLVILVADRFLVLLRQGRFSLRFCDRVLGLCSQGQFEEAERLAQDSNGVLSRTLKVCLAHRDSPPALLDDAIQETLLHEFPKLERFLPSIRMLSSIAPMLGLLGTVTGIITTFDVITVVGSGQPRLMAGGIAEALITTATGLAIAIPGLLAHSVLSGKVDSIISDTERFSATLSNLVKQHQHTTANDRNR